MSPRISLDYNASTPIAPEGLAAMSVPAKEGMGAVRFSLGRATSWEELEEVLVLLRSAIG